MLVGFLYVAMAVARLDVITSFIPDPVLSGFCTGAAVVICTSQMQHWLGISVPRGDFTSTWLYIFEHLSDVNWHSMLIGVASLLLLFAMKAVNKSKFPNFAIPEQLLVIVLFTPICWFYKLDETAGVRVIGFIPAGLTAPSVPEFSVDTIRILLAPALTTALVTYILTIQIAKSLANSFNTVVSAHQELYALAGASVVSSFFGCYPPGGSFSRSALLGTLDVGTPLHNLFSALVVATVLLVLTPAMFYIPMAVLASIIFQAFKSMLQYQRAVFLFRICKDEFVMWMVAFLATVLLDVMMGTFISIAFSILVILKRQASPHFAVLGKMPGVEEYRDVALFEQAQEIPGIKVWSHTASYIPLV